MLNYRWKSEEADLVVSLLKKGTASLRLDHRVKAALVSRSKYAHHFPQLRLTTKALEAFSDTA